MTATALLSNTTALLSKIEATLKSEKSSSSELNSLLAEIDTTITEAAKQREQALNPAIPATDQELERIAVLTLTKNRLAASVSRLQVNLDDALARERYRDWKERFDVLEGARDLLSEELKSTYPTLVHKLIDLLGRIAVNDAAISALHTDRPAGVKLHLQTAEMKARNLDGFTGSAPSITKKLQLPLWAADERLAYPQKDTDYIVSTFAPVERRGDRVRYSADWAKSQAEDRAKAAAQAAARAKEQEKQDAEDARQFNTRTWRA